MVHHGRDAVETVAVELVLIHPPAGVRKEEAQSLPVAIVETARVPHPVISSLPPVEVHAIGSIKHADPVVGVFAGVAVHDVHQDHQTQAMRFVDQSLEFIGRAETTGRGEEVGHVIAEGGVIGMLLNGHDLDGIIAEVADAREHVTLELGVAVDLGLTTGHSDVAFVDTERAGLVRSAILEHVTLVRVKLSRLALLRRLIIDTIVLHLVPLLSGPFDPGGDAVDPLTRGSLETAFHFAAVWDSGLAVLIRKEKLPHTELILKRPMAVTGSPFIKFTDQGKGLCGRSPFAVPYTLNPIVLAAVETIDLITL
mmetsp:Transcript_3077/g.5032  ORF Transcript_3077/g.5032 Transcript_3077/m.5032 type:complete len:310 (-) Transcript_3077:775-1704(-)